MSDPTFCRVCGAVIVHTRDGVLCGCGPMTTTRPASAPAAAILTEA